MLEGHDDPDKCGSGLACNENCMNVCACLCTFFFFIQKLVLFKMFNIGAI